MGSSSKRSLWTCRVFFKDERMIRFFKEEEVCVVFL